MKLVNSKVEIVEQAPGVVGALKQVEIAARNCYQSGDKIDDESYKHMIDVLVNRQHFSPFEAGTVYLTVDRNEVGDVQFISLLNRYEENTFSKVRYIKDIISKIPTLLFVTTNMRVIYENKYEDDLRYFTEPTEMHVRRITYHITSSRAILDEIMRHRAFSYCCMSTRYCNFSKDKFNNEITFTIPSHLNIPEGSYSYWDGDWCDTNKMQLLYMPEKGGDPVHRFLTALQCAETDYLYLIKDGWKPQQARDILPLAVTSTLIMTGDTEQYKEFFKLRCAPAAHPDMQVVAYKMKELYEAI